MQNTRLDPFASFENDTAIEKFIGAGWCMGFIEESRYLSNRNLKQLIKLFPQAEDIPVRLNFVTKKKASKRYIEREFKKHLFAFWNAD